MSTGAPAVRPLTHRLRWLVGCVVGVAAVLPFSLAVLAGVSLREAIVAVNTSSGQAEIVAMHADGSGLLRLSQNPGTNYAPSVSPDRKWVVYTSSDANFSNSAIYRVKIDGTGGSALTHAPMQASTASFSPDGMHIIFSANVPGSNKYQVFVMDPDGANMKQLTSGTEASRSSPRYSADGRMLAFSSFTVVTTTGAGGVVTSAPVSRIDVMAADGTGDTAVSLGPLDNDPVWAGPTIFFDRMVVGSSAQIYSVNSDGTGEKPFGDGAQPDVSADGKSLIYAKAKGSGFTLAWAPISGGRETMLGPFPADTYAPRFADVVAAPPAAGGAPAVVAGSSSGTTSKGGTNLLLVGGGILAALALVAAGLLVLRQRGGGPAVVETAPAQAVPPPPQRATELVAMSPQAIPRLMTPIDLGDHEFVIGENGTMVPKDQLPALYVDPTKPPEYYSTRAPFDVSHAVEYMGFGATGANLDISKDAQWTYDADGNSVAATVHLLDGKPVPYGPSSGYPQQFNRTLTIKLHRVHDSMGNLAWLSNAFITSAGTYIRGASSGKDAGLWERLRAGRSYEDVMNDDEARRRLVDNQPKDEREAVYQALQNLGPLTAGGTAPPLVAPRSCDRERTAWGHAHRALIGFEVRLGQAEIGLDAARAEEAHAAIEAAQWSHPSATLTPAELSQYHASGERARAAHEEAAAALKTTEAEFAEMLREKASFERAQEVARLALEACEKEASAGN